MTCCYISVMWGYRKPCNEELCDLYFLAVIMKNYGRLDTRGTVVRLPERAARLSFPHNFRNDPKAHRPDVFLQSGREADHVPTCQRMRGAKLPLLDIASCLIQYVGYFTLHWRGFGWWRRVLCEIQRTDVFGGGVISTWQSDLYAAFTAALWNWWISIKLVHEAMRL